MDKIYRIFHLIKGLGRGGAERLLSEGLRYANRTKFSYGYGYFLPWKDALVSELQGMGAEATCFNCRHPVTIILSARRLAKFLKEREIDLVHCHLPLAGIVGRLAARMTNIPLVYTEHNLMERYHPWTRRANLWTWKWQSTVIAVSNKVADAIHSQLNSKVPVLVIQNGVAVDTMIPSSDARLLIRQQFGIPMEAPVVGTVASFRATKNLSDWIKAARIVKDHFPDSHFLLVGDGPLSSALKNQVNSCGLESCVHFTGQQKNVFPYYSAMDVFMISSVFEGLPLALLESMGMLVPVVATNVGGITEVITDGKTGLLVEPRNPELLAEKVKMLLANNDVRKKLGIAARSVVEQRFDIKRMVEDLEQLYLEILGRPSKHAREGRNERLSDHSSSTVVY